MSASVGKGVPSAPTSIPKNIKQHSKPTVKDMTTENDLPPYLVRVALQPKYFFFTKMNIRIHKI